MNYDDYKLEAQPLKEQNYCDHCGKPYDEEECWNCLEDKELKEYKYINHEHEKN